MRTCGEFDSDSCRDWSPPTACASGQTCSNGSCGAAAVCANEGDSCDDGNACTTSDSCEGGLCSGTPKCTAAPANADPTCAADGTCGYTCWPGTHPRDGECIANNRFFATSSIYFTGNLGGLAGADADCQLFADHSGLNGTFKAWMSDTHISASARLVHSTYPYVLVDGTLIADDWAGLTSGSVLHAISLDEQGNPVGNSVIMTGTLPNGALARSDWTCNDWVTDTSGVAFVGYAQTLMTWSGYLTTSTASYTSCTEMGRLYCIEQ
jgi:hypothetical protein